MTIDTQKLLILRSLADTLSQYPLRDVNLLLQEVNLGDLTYEQWYGNQYWSVTKDDRADAVMQTIRHMTRSEAEDLADGVETFMSGRASADVSDAATPLVVFASHLAAHKAFVAEVGDELKAWGIKLFVAHVSIEPDSEWELEIRRMLRSSDAGVVFLHPKILESHWCDQEVGWLLGRGVPCLPLKFEGTDPYGFLGKRQAQTMQHDVTSEGVASVVVAWLAMKQELAQRFFSSLIDALGDSPTYRRTDLIWDYLRAASNLDDSQVERLLAALRDNDQVHNANGREAGVTVPYVNLILDLARKQPGYQKNEVLAQSVGQRFGIAVTGCPGDGAAPGDEATEVAPF